jgi:mycothiol S-conjugate amidase
VEVQRAAWPTEDYHLARSVVDTELPEDDLFAGVTEKVSL